MYNTWICETCGITVNEIDHDHDCHAYAVYRGDVLLGTIYPASVEDSNFCRDSLDDGGCPICDGWEDGLGHNCTAAGW